MEVHEFLRPSSRSSRAPSSRSSTPVLRRATPSRSREVSVADSVETTISIASSGRSLRKRKLPEKIVTSNDNEEEEVESSEHDNDEDSDYEQPGKKRRRKTSSFPRVKMPWTRPKILPCKHYESWKKQAERWEEGEDESSQQRRPVFLENAVDTWLDRVAKRNFTSRRLYHMARECGQAVCTYVSERLALTFEERKLNLKSEPFVGLRQHLTHFDSRQSDPNRL